MAYDRLKNNVDAINYAIAKNRVGETTTIVDGDEQTIVPMLAEDLSNFTDIGKNINELDADTIKSFAKDVITGIARNEFITDAYTAETNGIIKTVDAFNGALQRIAFKNVPEVMESHARNLVNGVDYGDFKYYGSEMDAKIFSDEFDFKTAYSIGTDDIEAKWDDMEWVDATIGGLITNVRNAIEIKTKGIADTLLNKTIVDAIDNGRVIHIIQRFNEFYGYTGDNEKTKADILTNRELRHEFALFMGLIMELVRDNIRRMSKKYNDGTVLMHTPRERIAIVGLTEFMNIIRDIDINEYVDAENVHQTLCWQSFGNDLVPHMNDTGTIKDGTFTLDDAGVVTGEDAATYNNVVMAMYDRDCMGACVVLNKTTVQYVGSEGYNTYFEHYGARQYVDERQNSVVFMFD